MRAIPERTTVNVEWLMRLRWAQVVGQAATITVAALVLGVALPVLPLMLVVGVGLASNLALELYVFGSLRRDRVAVRPVAEWRLAGIMMLDVALLTVLLALTGGPLNPFGFLYLVQIALATVLLRAGWAWLLVALAFVAYGVLLVAHQPLPVSDDTRAIGMWVAIGVASGFIVHFLLRITGALAERDAELNEARSRAARRERLASLATMAAGAAHELSTPLGTVALVAKELERHLTAADAAPHLVEDARLIRDQVARCRGILDQMAGGAGTVGEGIEVRTVGAMVSDCLTDVRAAPPVRVDLTPAAAATHVRLPPRAVAQALRSLITNAQDASPPDQPVHISASIDPTGNVPVPSSSGEPEPSPPPRAARAAGGDRGGAARSLRLVIIDRGAGMSADVLARVGEPFYTTKAPGRGMGLGMYLARAVVEGIGGTLIIESTPGRGTRLTVVIPVEVATGPDPAEAAPSVNAS